MAKLNILLVDDQPANLLALEAVLDGLGQHLVKAKSGEEALRFADQETAVILLDVQMHGLDGFETAKRIRNREQTRHTPIIFLTAYDDNRLSVEEAYTLGAVDYLVKPLVPVILRAKVAGFVELFKKTQEVEHQAEQLRQLERREFAQRLALENARLDDQKDLFRTTLASIGDAVITTDTEGHVTFLNAVAQFLTGWTPEEAAGQSLETVFHIVNEETRETVENPATRALREGVIVGLANHTLLISKDGTDRPIDDSAAPIRNAKGEVAGVVLVFRDVTERRRQGRLVQDALAYADNIIATMREPFLVLDKNLRVQTANRSFYETFHVSQEETANRLLYDLGNGQWNIPRLRELLNDVLPQNHAFDNYEVEHDFPAIGRKVMLLNARRIRKPGNHSELILLAIEDITERKRAEVALRQVQAELRRALEFDEAVRLNMGEGLYTVDAQGCVTSMNPAAEKLFGWTHNELLGRKMHEVTHFKHRDGSPFPAEECAGLAVLRDGAVLTNHEDVFIRKDGSFFDVVYSSSPLRAGDEVVGVVVVFRDNSERKRMEAALRESEIRYRRLFEAAKDGILILDAANGKVSDANPFMSDLLGYSHNEFMGKELWEIGLFRDKSGSEAAVRELQQKGYIRYEHLPLESERGRRVEVEIVANVYKEDHTPVIQCNIRDITERRRLEKQTKDQAAELSDLHRRKDEFLAMLSHELRNPLAPIMNGVQLLGLQQNQNQLQQQARSIIERQVSQLAHLVDDLLEVSRITTGRIFLHEEQVAINGIVEHAVETAQPVIGQRRHTLSVSLPPQPIMLHADAARLEQVVVNLLNNAAKYTEEGGHIWLAVQQEDETAVLRVRDSGVGIAPALLPRIFDLFRQAERSLDRAQGGLGIGLCLVQRLVELHGGTVAAHSVLGEGSEFIVRLPVMRTSASQPPSPSKETSERAGPSLRVMVVDDNVDAAESMAMLVKASGHNVQTAYDGPTALEGALDYRPEVVLLDIGLPGLNGFEVAKRMRQLPVLQNVVLIAMTGYGQEADRQHSQEAGFDHHLVKPADFRNVRQILATVSAKAT